MELILKRVDFQSLSEHLDRSPLMSMDYRKPSFYCLVVGLLSALIVVLLVGYTVEKVHPGLFHPSARSGGEETLDMVSLW